MTQRWVIRGDVHGSTAYLVEPKQWTLDRESAQAFESKARAQAYIDQLFTRATVLRNCIEPAPLPESERARAVPA